jgi:predicted amidophosphoribosyltransferase
MSPNPSASGGAGAERPTTPTGVPATGSDGECRYCGGQLPTGRRTLYCPHCGQNLMVQRCPACGTELELNWRFCITCGRGVSGAAEAADS